MKKQPYQIMEEYLRSIGIDTANPNFAETPQRIFRLHQEMMYGMTENAKNEIQKILSKTFPCSSKDMIVFPEIETVALCPHHFLPVRLRVWVAYIPKGEKVIGLSKIPRLVQLLSKKPVLQEELAREIADTLYTNTENDGVYVIIEGNHSCMQDRGVKSKTPVFNSAIRGNFVSESTRNEALTLMFRTGRDKL